MGLYPKPVMSPAQWQEMLLRMRAMEQMRLQTGINPRPVQNPVPGGVIHPTMIGRRG
jgi:hypothetical protein